MGQDQIADTEKMLIYLKVRGLQNKHDVTNDNFFKAHL